jgi:hypothetical protein
MIVRNHIIIVLCFLFGISSTAQQYSAKVIDSKSGEPIPFATIQTGKNQGVITNEEGIFSFILKEGKSIPDSIHVSSMGYERIGVTLKKPLDQIIYLNPKPFELSEVFISTKNLTAKEIIEKVKERLDENYTVDLTKKRIFFRESEFSNMNTFDFGFKESTIEELNEALMDSISQLIPKSSSYYKEAVGDFYGDYRNYKLNISKAAELYDKNKDVSFDGVEKKLERIFKENVKPDSYLKIKSGIFGTKVQLDSFSNEKENAKVVIKESSDNDKHFQQDVKDGISEIYEQLFFHDDSKIDVLKKSNRYRFSLDNYTFIEGVPVYKISFSPKGKKDFKGTLYVNTEDFAVVRLDFDNVRPIKKFSLLGITYRHTVLKGKMLFGKDGDKGYSPRYIELENGTFFGLERPLKVIEKNKHVNGRRKQNELSLELDIKINNLVKYEWVIFESEVIAKNEFDNTVENKKVKATYMSQYDPEFWKEYTIMEPNAAIRSFKVIE